MGNDTANTLALLCCGYCIGAQVGAAAERDRPRARARGNTIVIVDDRRSASYEDASTAHDHSETGTNARVTNEHDQPEAKPVAPMPLLDMAIDRV